MKIAIRALAGLIIALCGFLVFAGYFDRDVVLRIPATARATPARSHLAAVYFSGDVGYRVAMGQMIGSRLAADGIPVVAINSLGYFRTHRTVAEVSALTAHAIRQALASGQADQVVLIGHSLGADALQAALVQLPQELRARIRAVVLIVPTAELYLRVSPGEMLSWSRPVAEVLPTLRQLTWVPTTCISGMQESDSPCPHLSAPNVSKVVLPGGHALDWNVDRVHSALIGAIDAVASRNITEDSGLDHVPTSRPGAKNEHPAAE